MRGRGGESYTACEASSDGWGRSIRCPHLRRRSRRFCLSSASLLRLRAVARAEEMRGEERIENGGNISSSSP